jgi:hypothetical protein
MEVVGACRHGGYGRCSTAWTAKVSCAFIERWDAVVGAETTSCGAGCGGACVGGERGRGREHERERERMRKGAVPSVKTGAQETSEVTVHV